MCKPTNELRLCTCKFGKTAPDSFWILHRFTAKDEQILGELICDFNFNHTEAAKIGDFIFASINAANCFDKNLIIKNNDVLEIHIVHDGAKYLFYYKFIEGRWNKDKEFNAFDIMNDYRAVSGGITKPEISTVLKNVLK